MSSMSMVARKVGRSSILFFWTARVSTGNVKLQVKSSLHGALHDAFSCQVLVFQKFMLQSHLDHIVPERTCFTWG
jgi:hypothetical protein